MICSDIASPKTDKDVEDERGRKKLGSRKLCTYELIGREK